MPGSGNVTAQAAAPAGSDEATARSGSGPRASAGDAGDIVVTGSRIVQNGNNSPTPLTVISTQQLLQSTPTTVAAALQQLPVFQNSLGQNTGTGGGNAGPNGAANAPNIRNLGLTRTLTLFDGKRLQATTDVGVVTIDMIPEMLLQRVDVVTGGVSAVYGSDAISGVVNFVTDRKFTGLSLKAQSGISQKGDDPIRDFGVAFGTNIGSRAHFEASLEYHSDPGILDMFSRPSGQLYQLEGSNPAAVSAAGAQTIAAGAAANPYMIYGNVRNAATSFGGLIRSGPLAGMNFSSNGVLTAFQHGTPTGTLNFEQGGDGAYNFNSSLKGALETKKAFARFDYDLADTVHFYVEGFGAKNKNSYNDTSLTFSNVTLRSQNPLLPLAYQYGTATTTFTFSKISQQLGPATKIFDLNSYYVNSGLNGDLGGSFKWDIGFSHGESEQKQTTLRNINMQHLAAALDAVTSGSSIVCRINADAITTNDDARCTPLNLFGPSASSDASLAYLTDRTVSSTKTNINDVGISITGAPISTWAGPVGFALSGEYRRTGLFATSQVPPEDKADCTGILYNCTQGTTNLHQVTFANISRVHQTVKEAALELDVPLLKDSAIARDLTVNLAGRYANYDTFGGAWTWKAGLNWQVNGDFLIRATRSRDFRAPNLSNLYGPATVTRANVIDQLTGVSLTNVAVQTGGNADLKPEVGNTLTAGIVFRPQWFSGFSLSVDAYDIKILNAITGLNGSNATVQKLCIASGGSSSLCDLIVRPLGQTNTTAANSATYFYSRSINAASIHTRGIDFETNFATRLINNPFSLRLLATYQPKLLQVTPSLVDTDVAGYAYSASGPGATPKWRLTGFLNFSPADTVRLSVSERWRSSLKWNTDTTLYYAMPDIPSFATTNLNLSFSPKVSYAKPEFYVNVQNLFNRIPPIAINSSADGGRFGAYVAGDDFVGRYFTAGIRVKL